ncbi:hypothetical protein CYL18_10495 [Pradoshia eiseniae]|uniref:DUF2642 domain-containing protein n=1 Tax=Pradoshia eiseniae TaxID=2064768 RepID=A0A2S7MZM1_9BACI|nr:hypothetical protein [Pradoshia eiseniae]PQD95203.1 hypothetical protein CYL18_10495 [Pradoshia eiseniae]
MDKKPSSKQGSRGEDINAIRQAHVTREFEENISRRALILMASYPFLIIGKIVEVVGDYVVIKAEVTNITELDGETFNIHIDNIEVFYIQKPGQPVIPDIRGEEDD